LSRTILQNVLGPGILSRGRTQSAARYPGILSRRTSRVFPISLRNLAALPALLLLVLLAGGCSAPVRVTWETETEMNTAGFNLYRGLSPDGPFDVKVNETLIPPSADPLTGQAYAYIDRTARAGATYYYELQEIERDGRINTHGPISVRAAGLDWRMAAVLLGLAGLVLALWWRGGRVRAQGRGPDAAG